MYLFVRDNGIKATVEYQMNLIGRCLRPHNSQGNKPAEDSDDEPVLKMIKKQSSFLEKENKRSVSLPAKKHPLRRMQSLKRKEVDGKEESWEELFFYYFEEVLNRYLADLKTRTQDIAY